MADDVEIYKMLKISERALRTLLRVYYYCTSDFESQFKR
jgi:hypothetical protein